MIPKRLFFIWLGSELPDYGKFCIQNFKQVNPDFEIMLVNEVDIKSTTNQDLKDCINLINSNELNFYNYLTNRKWAKQNLSTTHIQKLTSISDAFRFYLLDKYGGIYLDIDTFPIKAFDDYLLKYNGFAVNYRKNECDWFFIGAESNCVKNNYFRFNDKQFNPDFAFNKQIHRIKLQESFLNIFIHKKKRIIEKFLNCKLNFGESILQKSWPEYYVDHYRLNTWRETK